MNMNITYISIYKTSLPVLVSLLMEYLIGFTDTAYLGRVGEIELAASAIAGTYYMIIYMIGFGFSIGAQILIAQYNGNQQYKEAGKILSQGILFLLIIAVIVILFSSIISPIILKSIIDSESVLQAVLQYLDWRIYGFFFSFTIIMFRAFYIGIIHTSALMLNSITMVAINVILNYSIRYSRIRHFWSSHSVSHFRSGCGNSFYHIYPKERKFLQIWIKKANNHRLYNIKKDTIYFYLDDVTAWISIWQLVCFFHYNGAFRGEVISYYEYCEKYFVLSFSFRTSFCICC